MKPILAALAVLTATLAPAQRIQVSGAEFQVNGKRIWISGTNTPWENWNDFGGKFDTRLVEKPVPCPP